MSRVEKPAVLLVDDNEATRTLVTAILQREYTVEAATEGSEALEKIRTRRYSAILLDLRMPGLDGYGVLDALRASSPELLRRVIVLTAALTAKDMQRVKTFDICGVVAKPFEVEALMNAVRQCVDRIDGAPSVNQFFSSGMILLIADLLRQMPR